MGNQQLIRLGNRSFRLRVDLDRGVSRAYTSTLLCQLMSNGPNMAVPSPEIQARILRFGLFEVDMESCELRKKGVRLKLREQSHHILRILLEHPGEIVTREELRRRLWLPDTFVDFDHSLNTAMMRLREVLGDSSENPRFIETLPRRGYRFIAPVQQVGPDERGGSLARPGPLPAEPAPWSEGPPEVPFSERLIPAGHRWRPPFLMAVALGLCLLLAAGVVYKMRQTAATPALARPIQSLVVLPMENLSGNSNEQYFADGMTDELIASLARISSIRVLSRTTSMGYKGTHESLNRIAKELDVDAVVEGTVLRSGNRVRITAELIQVSTDRHLWADTYESSLNDILALQNRVASAIVDEIRIRLTPQDKARLATTPNVSSAAYEDYLKGLFHWNKRSAGDLVQAISYFESATVKDPQYALAYAGLADAYGILGAAIVGTVPTSEVAPKAQAAATRAVELDDTLAETQTALATEKFNYEWDWKAAEAGFRRAIALNANYATAHQRYSLYLIAMGRQQESLDEMERARSLDPLSVSVNFSLGWRLYMSRQYDRAIAQLLNTVEMDRSFLLPHIVLGECYEQKGDYPRAIAELQQAALMSQHSPPVIAALGHVYGMAGKRAEALKILDELYAESATRYVSPFYTALVYVSLRDHQQAADWLEKAYGDRSNTLVFANVDPQLDSLRSNPRFVDILRRMGF